MPVLGSRLDPASPEVSANRAAMDQLVAEPRGRTAAVSERGASGDDRSIARHRERGKLPVRERIDRLIEPGSAFLELSPLAANGLHDDEAPSVGIVLSTVRETSLPGGAWRSEAERDTFETPILEAYERENSRSFATARLWDDGIIDPLDTRRVLSIGLAAALHAPIPETRFDVFRR